MPTRPGATLRELRLKSGLTLAQLSKRTGLPVSTLSKVENDKMSLTYDKLARISDGLGVDIAQIFGGARTNSVAAAKGRRSITRAKEGGIIDTPSYKHVYHATDLLHKKFVPIIGEIKQRSIEEFGDFIRHEGEEYSLVLEGTLEFHSELYAPVILEAGDSIYFDSSMGHAYIAVGDAPCRVVSMVCASDLQDVDFEARSLKQPGMLVGQSAADPSKKPGKSKGTPPARARRPAGRATRKQTARK